MLAVLISIFSFTGTQGVAAQETSEDVASFMEEIVVTAEKREMSLQETPMAVSALTNEMLDMQGVEDIRSLQYAVPVLVVMASRQFALANMRGVGQDNTVSGADSGIALHLDGVYQPRNYAAGMSLFDMERVEVLRGPLGTLYGKNTAGGVINYITKKPTDEFEDKVDLLVSDYDHIVTRGAVNVPIVEAPLSIRVVVASNFQFRGTFYDNSIYDNSIL